MKAYTIILAGLLVLGMTGSSLANPMPPTLPDIGSIFGTNLANVAIPSYDTCASIKITDINSNPGVAYLFFALGAIIVTVFSCIAASLLKQFIKQLSFTKKAIAKKTKNIASAMGTGDAWVPTFQ